VLGVNASVNALSIVPGAAELYRRQIALELDGNPQAALKARSYLREWFGGKIRLDPLPDGAHGSLESERRRARERRRDIW